MDYNLIYQDLLFSINNSKLNYDIKEALKSIYNDQDLMNSINQYKVTKDESLKKKIYNNKKFMRYKKLENETNLLIMKLNNIFKELGDSNENN